jgi:hypothetical protein
MQEAAYPLISSDGSLPPNSPLATWSTLLLNATIQARQPANNPPHYADWMRQAGFTNIVVTTCKWPINTWPKDPKLKTIGLWNLYNTLKGLQGFTVGLFTRTLGWTVEEVEVLLAGVRKDLRDTSIHAYWNV